MAQTGRGQVTIDWDTVGKLLEAGCSGESIATQFGIHRTTLYNRCKVDMGLTFSTFSQQKKMLGDNLLRAKQYQTAMSGNVTMQIWLGKQRLGQTDKMEHQGKDGGPIRTVTEVIIGGFASPGQQATGAVLDEQSA